MKQRNWLTMTVLAALWPTLALAESAIDDRGIVVDAAQSGWDAKRLATMDQAVRDGEFPDTTSVLIVHQGRLVHEAYFGAGGRDQLNDTRSATKSVTALLVGAAVERGLLPGVSARVYDYFPEARAAAEADAVRAAITVEDLLTMSSMWECDDNNNYSAGNEERMYLSRNWTRFALELPIKGFAPWQPRPEDSPHGRAFSYCTAGSFLLGALIERVTEMPMATFADEVLHAPLGIDSVQWNRANEGVAMAGGGTKYRSRDLARIGQLLADGGRWQDRQVVSEAWIQAMLSEHVQARPQTGYGYLIWRFRFSLPDGGHLETWAMAGNGGNYVFAVPEHRLVAVITRTHYNQRGMHEQTHALFTDHVLRAMPTAPREDPPAAIRR